MINKTAMDFPSSFDDRRNAGESRSDPVLPRFKDQAGEASFHVGAAFPKEFATTTSSLNNRTPATATSSSLESNKRQTISQESWSEATESSDVLGNLPTATPALEGEQENTFAPYADVRLLTDRSLLELPSVIGNPYSLSELLPVDVPAVAVNVDTRHHEDKIASPPKRPAFVSATVIKPCADCSLGLQLATDGESQATYISNFNKEAELARILALSPLFIGDLILLINGTNCVGWSNTEIAQLLRSIEGAVTISVENVSGDPLLVETMIEKPSFDCKIGLGLKYTYMDGGFLQVSSVSGLFENTFIQKGDRIIQVNGERPRTVQAAINLIAQVCFVCC